MNNFYVLLAMIFLHVIDDYCLQGILANMKQKQWWRNHPQYQEKYRYDYLVALLMHSFSWTFMVMLPVAFVLRFNVPNVFLIAFIGNMVIHAFVDDLKANKMKINLIIDQSIHVIQIVVTFMLFVIK